MNLENSVKDDQIISIEERKFQSTKKLVIGISGKKLVGKSTIAEMLIKRANHLPLKICNFAFGDPVKEEVSEVYKIDKELCYTQEGKLSEVIFEMDINDPRVPKTNDCVHFTSENSQIENNMHKTTVRRLLQWYGTEYARKKNPNYWTEKTEEKIVELFDLYDIVIISDVRFPNEVNSIKSFPLHYICKILPYNNYPYFNDTHPSETALDNVNITYDNTFSPRYGKFHLRLVTNKIYSNVIVPFINSLEEY